MAGWTLSSTCTSRRRRLTPSNIPSSTLVHFGTGTDSLQRLRGAPSPTPSIVDVDGEHIFCTAPHLINLMARWHSDSFPSSHWPSFSSHLPTPHPSNSTCLLNRAAAMLVTSSNVGACYGAHIHGCMARHLSAIEAQRTIERNAYADLV